MYVVDSNFMFFFGFKVFFLFVLLLFLTDEYFYDKMSPNVRKPTMWILTRSDKNQAAQPLEKARGLGSRGIALSK